MKITDPFDEFGCLLFDETLMQERLPYPIYKRWKETVAKEDSLDRNTADAIAHAMKRWAQENGATHFTHWFQPMTGSTAEKHDSFIEPDENGQPLVRFSGKSLIKGEPDASSFPSGGLRATFEARGYTYWDCTSPAFIRDNILCIPTVFVSYNGESLDKKAPLLKSIEAISAAATRIVNIFGDKDVKRVIPMVGLEQEYFLIDKRYFEQREDLVLTGRTLFGTMPAKGQELEDHYFGSIPSRVAAFMKEVNQELWKLGIYAKTEHNEVAPCQFEIAPIFSSVNIAVDQNQLTMDVLRKTADKHGFACLLHEKPFAGINGSGKHNNWSLVTDDRQNLFEPGDKPAENIRFLVFVCAFIKAVDQHAELLRMSSSGAGNDHRLGANEAPPAIISIYLGSYIENVLNSLKGAVATVEDQQDSSFTPVSGLSYIPKDNTDRNRTSPLAFTGNKFEFRMLGSSLSASFANVVLNTITADVLNDIAQQLADLKYKQDIRARALEICTQILKDHERILFSGDGYSQEWVAEAKRRGLPNIPSFVESVSALTSPKTIELFTRNHVYTEKELIARSEIMNEQYVKISEIEAKVLIDMTRTEILPLLTREIQPLAAVVRTLDQPASYFKKQLTHLNELMDRMDKGAERLEGKLKEIAVVSDYHERGIRFYYEAAPLMQQLRSAIDEHETIFDKKQYVLPTYEDMLFHSN
ncbi:glutamine synthetase III [Holdemania massiliensis]|uniref:Glutamine synthetase type III n=1 Tax=Holdemania massiliensis TaxID=1468449 RepID=A0A6N7S2Z4_9FIRM|nr:glutamine synthetase III [Holdemania massiliensis]MSA72672.1 glutamine synthetase type III [Holdemania massiliensis]MSA88062.1 glutamine synthetase type III [Holdemania massiliensis]MSB79757.1 glutamine synthetase type III [Holdemania massiliensis]MSC34678.1 glutamine synthetase type III [Holdemania massiliensis]MSC41067.1 glutamine synthetase type III [Holdemania massiliensis]